MFYGPLKNVRNKTAANTKIISHNEMCDRKMVLCFNTISLHKKMMEHFFPSEREFSVTKWL